MVGFVHEPAGIAVEPAVCFFETAAAGFDEEVVDKGYPGDVEHAVDEVVGPFEVVDARGCCLDDEVVAEPVAGGGWRRGSLARSGKKTTGRSKWYAYREKRLCHACSGRSLLPHRAMESKSIRPRRQ
jgi:hypothetical protein